MPYTLDQKLVVAVASSALFDLSESDAVFRTQGTEAYREHQRVHQKDPLAPGVAFPFIRHLLALNVSALGPDVVEVVLLSRNDPDTGLRVFHSIAHHGLTISRAAFLRGRLPYRYIPAFDASVFLSANEHDVREAIMQGYPAGTVLPSSAVDDVADPELRIAFDFDGVLADDEAERVFHNTSDLSLFHESERAKALQIMQPGPMKDLLLKIAKLQEKDRALERENPSHSPLVRTAIITARNAPAHERMINTLREWGIVVDETFFLGGVEKTRVLKIFKPHIFFDDQRSHLDPASGVVPLVHVPFGVKNEDAID